MSVKTIQRIPFSVALLAVGCGGSDGGGTKAVPWDDSRTGVIQADHTASRIDAVGREDCDAYTGADRDACEKVYDSCGDDAADVVLDDEGKVIASVCYPGPATVTVDEVEASDGGIAQQENNAVLVLDDADDGVDLEGNLDVDANNVVVYGAGPDVSVIAGDMTIDGNNTVIRGVRIQGDVNVVKNDTVFLFCVIEGNLTVTANNTRLLACDVYGNVIITGNNTELVGDRVAGNLELSGMNLSCDNNVTFEDENGDLRVADEEIGLPLSCGDDKEPKK